MTVSKAFLARAGLIASVVFLISATPEARDRSETAGSWEASREARQAREAERRRVESLRRAYEFRRTLAHARLRSERDAGAMPVSSPPVAEAMCPVLSDPAARQEYQRQPRQWREQAFRRSAGLQPRAGLSVFSAAKGGKPAFAGSVSPAVASTARAVATAVLASTESASASSTSESGHMVPLFPSASDALGRQGFARVINHSAEAGEVSIEAFDDEGAAHGPLALSIDAGETAHFNSNDLENGNADKGLTGSTGPGQGDWRLEFESELDIEVLSYIRTTDGFLTAMHDTVPVVDGRREAAIFNPGSNLNQQSLLRLVNPGEEEAEVTVVGFDDRDASPGSDVVVSVPAGTSRTLTASELETGGEFEGALVDGAGKWRLTVNADRPISAMSLLSSPTGHLTNLSTAPQRGAGPACTRGSHNHQSESTSAQHRAPRRAIPGQAPVGNDRLTPGCDRHTSNRRCARPFRLRRPPPPLQRAQQTPLKSSPERPNNQPYFATIPFRVVIRPIGHAGRRLEALAMKVGERCGSDKPAGNGTEFPVVHIEGIAGFDDHRPGKRTGQDGLPGLQRNAVVREFSRQPGNAVSRMAEYGGGHTAFLDHPVPVEQRGHPAQIDVGGLDPPAAGDHARAGGIVGDGVEYDARTACLRVDPVASRGNDLDGRNDVVRRIEYVEKGDLSGERTFQHERQFDFHARIGELGRFDLRAILEEHVVEQRPVVGLVDVHGLLHDP